jgi:hypothetical protein
LFSVFSQQAHAAKRVKQHLPALRVAAEMARRRNGSFFTLANPTEHIKMSRSDQEARAPIAALALQSFKVPLFTGH